MKREICSYVTDSFNDFEGKTHYITVCAVSNSPIQSSYESLSVCYTNGEYIRGENDIFEVCRTLSIGVAICNPSDVFNTETGKKIAYNKAINSDPVLYAIKAGVINTGLVEGLIKQEVNFIKANPGIIISGYHNKKLLYEEKKALIAKLASLSKKEEIIVQAIIDGEDLQKYINLAKIKMEQLHEMGESM